MLFACGGGQTATDTSSDSVSDTESTSVDTGEVQPSVTNPAPDYVVPSFYDMTFYDKAVLSHTDGSQYADLELDYRSVTELGFRDLATSTVYYPRLKQMKDGRYVLFYQEGEHGNTIYYKCSEDLRKWTEPTELFVYDKSADRMYATCDAVVLDNGDIIAVCSFRVGSDYDLHPEKNGIMMKKSSDNAKSWSEEKQIYTGTTWEPYAMQLSSGEVQVYFTNTTCYYKQAAADASTGTALIRSFDGGQSWSADISKPYDAEIVSQTATRVSGGIQLYSDQMPVGIQMLGTNKIMLALETRLDKSGNYRITLSYSADNWATPLSKNEVGPREKITNAWTGAAPYLMQFDSGEIVCAYTRSNELAYRMIDSTGKVYSKSDTMPFEDISNSYWGALEKLSAHTVLGIGETFKKVTISRTEHTLTYGKLNLNHTLFSESFDVNSDGDTSEWNGRADAAFVGSESQAQASVRATLNSGKLTFAVDRLDEYLDSSYDTVSLYFSGKSDNCYYRLTLGIDGVTQFDYFDGSKFSKADASGIEFAAKVNATDKYGDDIDLGYSAEVSIPAVSCGVDGDIRLFAAMSNTDNNQKSDRDTLTGADMTDKSTWLTVCFK